ncbi:hypothetical protein [Novosphingobium sp. Fuku2-ISO-50]|uniref:hypothetical protein n=1 Tax=Novosphingobium sp. Fuku2-ISO-50 TaxID=1739114 RepID=UPI00076DCC4D|nr:hypothetical protein [Novosphingobium sp. Fuku2-ISO-50]KUR75517.1 hypothetical protein AQZ50_15320 [Novosphingobium sp. Fuku2-ISO-50]
MKATHIALVALAGLGLANAQLAHADTMPGAALPSVVRAHPAKVSRLVNKHEQAGVASDGGISAVGFVLGAAVLGGLIVGIVEATKSSNPVSTGA